MSVIQTSLEAMQNAILGISAYYHDSAAAILVDGKIVAAAQEERFTRRKHDSCFPIHACLYVLKEAGLNYNDLAAVAFYEKPFLKFERLLETYHAFAPIGFSSFVSAIPVWIKEKLFMHQVLNKNLGKLGEGSPPLFYPEHHLSHAASAFYPSPFPEAAILTIDGVGEWTTTSIGRGVGKNIEILREMRFPHSVGLLYSAFTYYAGFTVNSGEYKLMGLAPYGNPCSQRTAEFKRKITNELVDIRKDGSILLNMGYFNYATGLRMVHEEKWEELFGIPRRAPESEILPAYTDMAMAIQQVTEEIMLLLACAARELTGCKHLVLAGGVALNCVANGKIMRAGIFDDLWIQPAAGDAGGAVGAAYAVWHVHEGNDRHVDSRTDAMRGSYLGPDFSNKEISRVLQRHNAKADQYDDFPCLARDVASKLAKGAVVGWFQGRMELGPRALGSRSILADARDPEMQKKLNLKIKQREGFRPFAPSVREEDLQEYFGLDRPSPYMLLVAPVRADRQIPLPEGYSEMALNEKLYFPRSDLPAITHIDYSARIHTVSRSTNSRYWLLIDEFKRQTACGVIVNTSFNVRGEPIVCTPEDAYRCFMCTEMDYLVLEDYLLDKRDQPAFEVSPESRREFPLD